MKISNKDKKIIPTILLLEVASKAVLSYFNEVKQIQEITPELKKINWQIKMFSSQFESINLKIMDNLSDQEIKKYISKSEAFFKLIELEEVKLKTVKSKDTSIIPTILMLEVASFRALSFIEKSLEFKVDKDDFKKILWQYKMINTQLENMNERFINKLVGFEKADFLLKSEVYNRLVELKESELDVKLNNILVMIKQGLIKSDLV